MAIAFSVLAGNVSVDEGGIGVRVNASVEDGIICACTGSCVDIGFCVRVGFGASVGVLVGTELHAAKTPISPQSNSSQWIDFISSVLSLWPTLSRGRMCNVSSQHPLSLVY
jgi:hypothetical protein